MALACLIFALGCSRPVNRQVAVYPVDGQLMVGGQPAVGAVVTFYPVDAADGRVIITAAVQSDGRFMPTQPDGAVGLAEGSYRLTATWPETDHDRFDSQFADPSKPIAVIEVKSTVNLLSPINLP